MKVAVLSALYWFDTDRRLSYVPGYIVVYVVYVAVVVIGRYIYQRSRSRPQSVPANDVTDNVDPDNSTGRYNVPVT